MKIKYKKGLRPLLLKFTALLIGFCYLISPLQQQVFGIIHIISHTIEIPNATLSHELNDIADFQEHKSASHHHHTASHEHKFIDFFQTIFENSNGKNSSNHEKYVKLKYDKHLINNDLISINEIIEISIDNFPFIIEEPEVKFFKELDDPPKTTI